MTRARDAKRERAQIAPSNEPSPLEVENVLRLPPGARLKYFVKRVADRRKLYSLRRPGAGEGGWVLAGAADDQLVPVWSHRVYAELLAVAEWSGAVAEPISLLRWIQAWTPGMTRDGRAVAVFPVSDGPNVKIAAKRLSERLLAELHEGYGETIEDLVADEAYDTPGQGSGE
jgi:hypothetical protein